MLEFRKKFLSLIMSIIFISGITLGNILPAAAQVEETVQFDRDYYSLGQAGISVNDPTAAGSGSVTVTVTSSSDTAGIQVELAEAQGGNPQGVFTGSLTLTTENSDDTQDRLKVGNGDTITVTYNNTYTDTATVDTTPPQATSFTPVNGSKGLSPDTAQVSVVFSEQIDPNSGSGISIVDGNNNPVNIKFRSVTGNTLNIELYSLSYQQTYTVTIPAGSVVDLAGNPCSAVSWSFSTVDMELDRYYYKKNDLVSITLYDQEKNSATVKATDMNSSTTPIQINLSGSGGVLRGSFDVPFDDGTFTVEYDRNGDGWTDVSADGYVDGSAPMISSHWPEAGATGVAIDEPITITFSEKIQAGNQFNLIDIGYNDGSGWQSAGGIVPSIDGKTLTINHADLEYSTKYDVVVYYDSIQDLVGNSYVPSSTTGQTVFQFTTQARPVQTIHVATTGDDSSGDGTENNPYQTIGRALEAAYDGDTIIVHDGEYNENVLVTKDVTITSLNGPEATTLQPAEGDGFVIQPAIGSYGTRSITGFTITGASHGISVSGMSGGVVCLENNIISGCGDGVYIDNHTGGTVYVQKNTIAENTVGIRLGTNADGAKTRVKWNNIVNNNSGIVHNGSNQLDAPFNYWGSPHGPTHDGINYGDSIDGDIDFQPWLVAKSVGKEITTELDITAPTLGDGYVGLEYLTELPIQPNVGSTLQWSLYSGSLPDGLNVVSGRALYGKPAVAGSYSFALEASNGTQAVYRDLSLNVAASYTGIGPAVVTRTPAPYETGVAVEEPIVIVFNEPVQLADNYQGFINITNPGDYYETVYKTAYVQEAAIVIDPTYNLMPAASYKVAISENIVTDFEGNPFMGTQWNFTTADLHIPLEITTTELPPAAEGQVYSTQLEATGGSGRYIWSVVSGSLPQGLTLDSLSGEISGTPAAAGSYSFTVQVTDGLNNTVQKPLTLTVEGVDITPPALVSTSPAHNATGVSRDIMITVEFSEPIQAGSKFEDISLGFVALNKAIEGKILKLTPGNLLDENTWYTVEIPAGAVKDTAGNETTSIISFSFQTGEAQDTQPPQVSITTPEDGALLGGVNTVTGTITEGSLDIVEVSLYRSTSQQYWNGSSWLEAETWNQASFSGTAPNYQFQYVLPTLPDGNYQVRVRALDYAGNTSEVKTVSFEMDSTQPVVVSTVPANGASNVAVDQLITVTFSEDVVPGDLTAVTLKDANTQNVVSTQASWNEQTATLIITYSDLEYNTDYELFIDEGVVKDLAGNNNVEKFITFRTAEGDGDAVYDLDGNNIIDIFDIVYVAKHMNDPAKYNQICDFNNDGSIDLLDLSEIARRYNMTP